MLNFASPFHPKHFMNSMLPPIKVFAGTKSRYMAEEICKDLGIELGQMPTESLKCRLRNQSAVAKSTSCNQLSPTPTTLWNYCL